MSREWTKNQKKAIDVRGRQALISAAAGSGKTAVLTERVKNILCDEQNPCSATEILVVTYTKAAAGEMRERTSKALKAEIKKNPHNKIRLKKELTLLPSADICTMDSFCAKIVRENFHLAKISSDFTMLDESEHTVLKNEVVTEVLEEFYEENDDTFNKLRSFFVTDRGDKEFEDVIINLQEFSMAYPSPEFWLDSVAEYFNPDIPVSETIFSKELFLYLEKLFDYYKTVIKRTLKTATDGAQIFDDFTEIANKTLTNLEELYRYAKNKDYDKLVSLLYDAPIVNYPRISGKYSVYKATNDLIKDCKAEVENLLNGGLPSVTDNKKDMELLFPLVNKLTEVIKAFSKRLLERKEQENAYSFFDILHKCIDVLVRFNPDGTYAKTALSEELSQKYKEILIDEYQDTNEAQNMIFQAISRNKTNFYCVGDVKQSIYRFRLASPKLFMTLKDELPLFNESENGGTQIILEQNFRSRKGVTECVNYIFSKIMSRETGEIDYNEKEYLNCGAKYEEVTEPEVELHVINSLKKKSSETLNDEAEYVAKYIRDTVKSGVKVKDGEVYRPSRYDDFAVILRATKKKAQIYADALCKLGIPSVFENQEVNTQSKEISLFVSLIKTVSNPLIDIPLVSVMMSALFGFTIEEVSEIRLINKKTDFYTCLLEYAKTNIKAEKFLRKLDFYRNVSLSYPIYDFVKLLADDTAIKEIFLSANNGEERLNGINSVLNCAKSFTDSGKYGLSEFIRYLDSFVESASLKSSNSEKSSGVRIMSVHKSKGLEFPFVILADCSKGKNNSDAIGDLLVARETGIGMKIRDDENFTKYGTISSIATERVIKSANVSEELRILYVALTRAKEHLVFICSVKSQKSLERLANTMFLKNEERNEYYLHPYAVYLAKNYSDLILSSLLLHPDATELREFAGCKTTFLIDANFKLKTVIANVDENSECEKDGFTEEIKSVNQELLKTISERTEYIYKYDDLSSVLAKRSASSVERHISNKQFFASKKPKFIDETITGALKGTAVHKFLELCDFEKANFDLESEIQRLLNDFLLTEKEISVLDKIAVTAFLNSSVGKRLLKSNKVLKEYEFSVLRDAGEFYPDLNDELKNEKIVIQGKLDCAFFEDDGVVLIDYKTDNTENEEQLISVYSPQLAVYKSALSECVGKCVKETYIYSFKMKKFIKVG